MRQFTTKGIVLARTDYAEADRILTFLTPDSGKVKAIAKGVRRSKSKLAGGIELFSVSELTLIVGRGEINTLISTRLVKHYGNIVKDIGRTTAAYELIRMANKATEDAPEEAYFNLLQSGFEGLNDQELEPQLTVLWFEMQLLKLAGHAPDLKNDVSGNKLKPSSTYTFHIDRMRFTPKEEKRGSFTANHIKFLRLGFAARGPNVLRRISDVESLADSTQPLVQTMLRAFVRT